MILFLYGEDSFRSHAKLNELENKFKAEVDVSGMNLVKLDGEAMDFESFKREVFSNPFLAKRRMVIIKNLLTANRNKKLHEEILKFVGSFSQKEKKTDTVIIFWEEKPDQKTKLFKRLAKEKYSHEFSFLDSNKLISWIKKRVGELNSKISSEAVGELVKTVGPDLWRMDNEIFKLVNFCLLREINKKDVEEMVEGKLEDDIFKLIDAACSLNKKEATRLISNQFELGVNENYILTMLIWQFRNLINVKMGVSKKLHPFVAKKLKIIAQRFSLERLKMIYRYLLNTEVKLKSGSSKLEPEVLFDLLIFKI